MSRRRAAAAALAALLAGRSAALAQPPQPVPSRDAEITIEASSSDMVRRSAVFTTLGQALNRAVDAGLDATLGAHQTRKKSDVLIRLGRLWFVNLPIAALAQGAAHDSGHIARWAEFSSVSVRRDVKQWPWPVPIALSTEYFTDDPSPVTVLAPQDDASVLAGGEQGSTLAKQRLTDDIYRHDTAGYFQWILLAYSSLDYPIYAWTDLSREFDVPGDFRQYLDAIAVARPPPGIELPPAQFFAYLRADREHKRDRLQHDAWLNLADFSLWQAFGQVGRYVATGERRAANAAVTTGRIRLVPAAYATLTPLGPERGANVHVIGASLLTRFNVRRITTPDDESLWGTGVALRSRDPNRWLPEANVDLWQRSGKHPGARVEAGTMHAATLAGRRWECSFRVGYKTEGYLLDGPQRATALASVALGGRF